MLAETTINLRGNIRKAIDCASESTGMHRSKMIILLMKRVLREYRKLVRFEGTIKYQKMSENDIWRKTHFAAVQRDYEMLLDMRKLFKCSVSLLVSFAVEKYLDELVDVILNGDFNEEADNYPFQSYIIAHRMAGDVPCWMIYWGMPAKKELTMLFTSA